ncbi:MAG TPA: TIM barrel protein [candidate division Zixibacteria bacterium]|nr:TIM barrel protein [candidate division Zixibacteria bacterium]
MADHPRFGPAGVPPSFRFMKAALADVPRLLQEEGLDAFEYEAVRWGKNPQIKKEDAEELGLAAKEKDVWLSLHGSYFINFCGAKQIVEASKQRLIACVTAANWMNAHVVVFHPGFYGENSPKQAFCVCLKALQEVAENIRSLGIRDVKIGPETMGRLFQLGSLDEVMRLCEMVEQTQLVIDWSHLHAREQGRFRTVDDFRRVVEEVEIRLGTDVVENIHCHFTKIEFTGKGEKRHHTLEETRYGPKFEMLAKVISEFRLKPVIISESPILDIDAAKMRDILQNEWSRS